MTDSLTVSDIGSVLERAQEADVRLVRFLWCGNDGTVRAKATGRTRLASRLASGIGVSTAVQATNVLDEVQPVGPRTKVRLIPDPLTFRVLPYAPRTGAVICDHVHLGDYLQPDDGFEPVCQRTFLRRMEARLAERDAVLRVGFANQFLLAGTAPDGTYRPLDSSLGLSTIGLTASQDYVEALVAALEEQDIAVDQYATGPGGGQQEVTVAHHRAMHAADDQIHVRETIRGVAARRGLVASLAPRPWPESARNACQIHFSVWSGDGRNRFHAQGAGVLTGEARSFLAGIVEHLPGLCALARPSFNSYRRWDPEHSSDAYAGWGPESRSVPLRVPSSSGLADEGATNVQLRMADASANPHLLVGGLIAAGLDGLERGLNLPEPLDVDPATLSEQDRAERGLRRLPRTQGEALDALEGDRLLSSALGPDLVNSYLAVRRSEWDAFSRGNATFEQQGHFLKY